MAKSLSYGLIIKFPKFPYDPHKPQLKVEKTKQKSWKTAVTTLLYNLTVEMQSQRPREFKWPIKRATVKTVFIASTSKV